MNTEWEKARNLESEKEHLDSDNSIIGYCPECFRAGAEFGKEYTEKRAEVLVKALKYYQDFLSRKEFFIRSDINPKIGSDALAEWRKE